MSAAKKIMAMAVVLAGFSLGIAASGRPTATRTDAATLAHRTGHESRTVRDCEHLEGDENASGEVPATNQRYWCLRCIRGHENQQHFHPDCPVGSRCSPNNGARQCGGGTF